MIPAIAFPVLDPVAIALGPIEVRWYALAYIAGILLGWRYVGALASNAALWGGKSPFTRDDVDDFVVWATIGIIVGGRIGYVIFYNLPYYAQNLAEIPMVWRGGMSFHGGFLGVLCVIVAFAWKRKFSPVSLGDAVCAAAPIGLLFGRIANFVNAELVGRATDVPWAVIFPGTDGEPRHPSQIYEALLEGLLLFIIIRIATHQFKALEKPGLVSGIFLAGYGAGRGFVEFFREPDGHIGFLAGGLTMGMILSIPMILVGLGVIFWSRNQNRNTAAQG